MWTVFSTPDSDKESTWPRPKQIDFKDKVKEKKNSLNASIIVKAGSTYDGQLPWLDHKAHCLN